MENSQSDLDLIEYSIIISVDANKGEQDTTISRVSATDMMVLDPILRDIQSKKGYFPTTSRCSPGQPSARDLYHDYVGWDVFISILPKPISGFTTILKVLVFPDNPLVMDMLV